MMVLLGQVTDVPLDKIAGLGAIPLVTMFVGWVIWRAFPALLARIDRLIDNGEKRDESRLQLFLQLDRDRREEDSRRRNDHEVKMREAFIELGRSNQADLKAFTDASTSEMRELKNAVQDLADTIKEQGIRP